MHFAAGGGHTHIMKFLKENRCPLCITNVDRETPLHLAAVMGQIEAIQWLLQRGADCEFKNIKGETAEDLANKASKYAAAKLLRDYKVGVNEINLQLLL